MSRSVKKGPYVAPELLKRVEEMNKKGEKNVLKTWSRSSTIFPAFVGHTIAVHDGRRDGDRRGGFRRDGQGFNRDRQNGGYNRGPRPEGGFRKPAEKKEGGAQ